ncbi:MAG TPA: CocE/NonD family hydrolase [Steroidobacteraceae bacterium]
MKRLILSLLLLVCCCAAAAQELQFHPPASVTDAAMPAVMRDLADRILPVYQEKDPERYLRNLSALQMAAGNYPAAWSSRESLRDRRRAADAHRPVSRSAIFDIYVHAMQRQADEHTAFSAAFAQSYWDLVSKLDDQNDYLLTAWLTIPVGSFQDALQRATDQWRGKGNIPLPDAVELIHAYLEFDAYRAFHSLVAALNADDEANRYVIDWDLLIHTADGGAISAVMVRPKDDTTPLPTLLEFTIHVDANNFARECAAHGYVGIVAFTRGERRSPGEVVPYLHDGEDARAVINWIARQPWSDGRVGMYGSSYSAFTQWAAARRLPPALKAMATSSATVPGIDFPMTGNIVHNSAFRWSGCVSNTKGFDEKTCSDEARWRTLNAAWYASGKSYAELDRTFGARNRIFHQWLDHPSYDRFWQKFVPQREQFAHINIPVLATTGYYAAGELGTLYYFTEHTRHDPHASQTLLIGPYDDNVMQNNGAAANLQGYALDQAALIDLRELRYQWFDSIFKGGERPALLKDRVNFEVMGANEWRHAPSLEAMAKGTLRFYLDAALFAQGGVHRLSLHKPTEAAFVRQKVDFADRTDALWTPPAELLSQNLSPHYSVQYVSEPLRHALELDGAFSGRLDLRLNKMDVDLNVAIYELLADGQYLQLFDPAYEFRASYVRDRVNRHLLKAGERQQLSFRSERLMSRQLQAGSRIVLVLGVNKRPDEQINYGTGGPVNQESIADAKVPLNLRWYADSYIELPLRR